MLTILTFNIEKLKKLIIQCPKQKMLKNVKNVKKCKKF